MTRTQFLKSLRSLVAYHRSCGIDHYPASEGLRSVLRTLDQWSDRVSLPPSPHKQRTQQPAAKSQRHAAPRSMGIHELAREIGKCRICSLHEMKKISTPGRGGSKPQLMIVGDWLVHEPGAQGNELFGTEQDEMLMNMVKAIDLGPDDIFITNVIKCSVKQSYQAESEHLTACVSYLKQQISLLLPSVICTMGTVASQTLLNTNESLIGLRGTFHQYVLADGTSIPVMPTFHPTYLLKNLEMKKPTWSDLQAVRKQLDSMLQEP